MERKKNIKPKQETFTTDKLLVMSTLVNRMGLASKINRQTFEGDRHIYEALGYPLELTFDDYFARYDRQDIAKAIIDRPVKGTWQGNLSIVEVDDDKETPLEIAWKDLNEELGLKSIFSRLDKLTGIGRYGVLLLGTKDITSVDAWKEPLNAQIKNTLAYLKPLSESSATIQQYESDASNPRYGKPLFYSINVQEASNGAQSIILVHYSRVIHVVDDILESDIEGTPRLKPVFNRLIDLEKLVGGDAEMFWKGARPGYTGTVDKDYQMGTTAKEGLVDQIDEFEHNLRRVLVNEGVTYTALAQQIADPTSHVDAQIQMISAITGIPKRILVGSERGELSSGQDSNEWKTYIQNRREEYAEISIVRPFVERMIELKILPEYKERYTVDWSDLFSQSEKEQVEIGKLRTEALKTYADSPMAEGIMPPKAFLEFFLGLDEEQITLIAEMQDASLLEEAKISPEEEAMIEEENNITADEFNIDEFFAANGGPGSGPNPGSGSAKYETVIIGKKVIDPQKTVPVIKNIVEKIAGSKLSMSTSNTKYGASHYMNIIKGTKSLKVRISDHSVTNINRMNDEVHLYSRRLPHDPVNKAGYKEIQNWIKNN